MINAKSLNKRKIAKGLTLVVLGFSFLLALSLTSSVYAKRSENHENHGNHGSVKTTDTEDTVNQNHYKQGQDVYLQGSNFDEGTYDYAIYTNPPSAKKGEVVTSGSIDIDSSGEFKDQVWTVPEGADKGPYKVVLYTEKGNKKQDNFLVKCKPEKPCKPECPCEPEDPCKPDRPCKPKKPCKPVEPMGGGQGGGGQVTPAVSLTQEVKELPKAGGTGVLVSILGSLILFGLGRKLKIIKI